MIFSAHKNKALISSLLLFSGITAQSAHATSAYSSTATYEFTITATNTNVNSNSLSGLTIGGTIIDDFEDIYDPILAYSPIVDSNSSVHSINASGSRTSYTQIFHAEDSISDDFAESEYLGSYIQTFENTSQDINDSFDITIDYSYNLSTNVSGQNADTDINIALSNYDYTFDLADFASASISGGYNDPANNVGSFSFILSAGEFDILFAETTITGTIQSTTALAPVPVPAAFWLFATAIMALPGIRKFKAA